jgi:glutamine synthetase
MMSIESMGASALYGANVFGEAVMRQRLPKNIFKALKRTIDEGLQLDANVADVVSTAMKDWAVEKGATHYCHWFQPLTGMTAEKHDSFISPTGDGRAIMEFSGKELIQGEPDASSFPSGGLRATFEARGYTVWDCTSPVFVKSDGDNTTMFIPSAFCSYKAHALDKKTPLLRSMDAISKQALRVLRAMGSRTAKRVVSTVGSEQEYFLVDRKFVEKRLDLVLAGRTLFGAPSPKGQEMEDQYFGSLHERIGSFMNEVNTELWKLGISAKTQHNEVAPAQYEIAPIFSTVNVSTDHNQLTMETLRDVGLRHGFVCLLHEKPFAGINGSGKHNNWSMTTDTGVNLLEPGSTPHTNSIFLVFLCAIIRAVDTHAELLRATVATHGNDHRLGANEAPPAIVSIFLGDMLTDIIEKLACGGESTSKAGDEICLGSSTLPPLPKDSTDRNRTSPFAFTGNKFEFRMVGSSQSTAGPNFVINTIVAETLGEIADELEKASDINAAAQAIVQRIAKEHSRVIYNGDNYTEEWQAEAKRRGLPNIKNTVDSLAVLSRKDIVDVFRKHAVLSPDELAARQEVLLDHYSRSINIEAQTALQMAKRQILPAALTHAGRLAATINSLKQAGGASVAAIDSLNETTRLADELKAAIGALEKAAAAAASTGPAHDKAACCRDAVIPAMASVRSAADGLERIVDAGLWPLPTYAEMLFLR